MQEQERNERMDNIGKGETRLDSDDAQGQGHDCKLNKDNEKDVTPQEG